MVIEVECSCGHRWLSHAASGRTTRNYGIIFSVWDWLFGTAVLPAHPPEFSRANSTLHIAN